MPGEPMSTSEHALEQHDFPDLLAVSEIVERAVGDLLGVIVADDPRQVAGAADETEGEKHAPAPPPPHLLTTGLLAAAGWQLVAKRALDLVLGTLALVVALPLAVLVAVAVGLSSPGPILYRQDRVGRDGRIFRVLKFRSMYLNAHEARAQYLHLNELSGPVFKIRKDPRVTPVGRVLRKLSLDELPQLVNVLRGDMSLVGPRPPLPSEYDTYGPRERARLLVKPGLTCVWQVSGRSNVDFHDWVEMDLDYIRSWSLRLDVWLLLRTVPAVLMGRGAC